MILDAHAHHFLYENFEEVVQENVKNEVVFILENGLNSRTNQIVLENSEKYEVVYAALGLHPTEVVKLSYEEVERELEFIKNKSESILAIGEVGLDFYWIKDRELQAYEKKVFELFLSLAESLGKPVVVHSRQAEK